MNNELRSLFNAGCNQPVQAECCADTLISNLKQRQLQAKQQLESVTAALDALEKNPDVANVLDLLSKTRG